MSTFCLFKFVISLFAAALLLSTRVANWQLATANRRLEFAVVRDVAPWQLRRYVGKLV